MNQFINLNTIIGNGKSYRVPVYQCDYSWTSVDWEDLWNDIEALPAEKNHYMGYLVLQNGAEDEAYWVIDGQQRLTTCSILALAVTALLKKWSGEGIDSKDNDLRREKETERYLGNFSTSKLTMSPKLTLNRNNDDFYRSWLLQLRTPPSIGVLKPSQKLLQKAFNYFYDKLVEKFDTRKSGAELVEFLEKTVGTGLQFTIIEVQNDLDAFKVFETLNARGVKLSPADLLKNYLFSQVARQSQLDLDEAERRWNNISDGLKSNELTTYLRHYWNSRYKLKRQPELFKAIRKLVEDSEHGTARATMQLLADLEDQTPFYAAFPYPFNEIWHKEEQEYLNVLTLLEVTTCYALMLAVLRHVERHHFKTVLRELVAITLRYNLSGRNPNEAERQFSDVANKVSDGSLKSPAEIIRALTSIYVNDDMFEVSFASLSISTRRKKDLVKYLLVSLENQLAGSNLYIQDPQISIEHILPEKPGAVWEPYFEPAEQEEYIYRIGNYTLLSASTNNKLSNETSYSQKLDQYKTSKYALSSRYCMYESFTPQNLANRQERMARLAKSIWKSNYIDQ